MFELHSLWKARWAGKCVEQNEYHLTFVALRIKSNRLKYCSTRISASHSYLSFRMLVSILPLNFYFAQMAAIPFYRIDSSHRPHLSACSTDTNDCHMRKRKDIRCTASGRVRDFGTATDIWTAEFSNSGLIVMFIYTWSSASHGVKSRKSTIRCNRNSMSALW